MMLGLFGLISILSLPVSIWNIGERGHPSRALLLAHCFALDAHLEPARGVSSLKRVKHLACCSMAWSSHLCRGQQEQLQGVFSG
jgi:hypothetical protein